MKVLYSGYMVSDSVSEALEHVKKGYFYLCDDDIETLNDFGSVKIHTVIGERLDEYDMLIWEEGDDLPLVQYRGHFTDRQGNGTPFEITKGQNTYSQENGNRLKILFDETEPADIKPTETTLPPAQPKEKTSVYQVRNDDFTAWIESESPPLNKMTKVQIHDSLISRNSRLWSSGFKGWWEQQRIYKPSRGRKSRHNRIT